jgi:hypothetical protein
MKNDLKEKTPHVIKLQAWWRMAVAKSLYKQLRLSKNADLKIVKQYISLFSGKGDEADEENFLLSLRGNVVQKIRENITSETELANLDAKVALLVKNRITLDEVAHLKSKDMRKELERKASKISSEVTQLTLRGNDRDTKSKKKKYEELFYVLQTQPAYLASLMYTLNNSSGGTTTKFLEQVVLTLFGYAQNAREEYLFLKLIEVPYY